jgi:hypothetical protein
MFGTIFRPKIRMNDAFLDSGDAFRAKKKKWAEKVAGELQRRVGPEGAAAVTIWVVKHAFHTDRDVTSTSSSSSGEGLSSFIPLFPIPMGSGGGGGGRQVVTTQTIKLSLRVNWQRLLKGEEAGWNELGLGKPERWELPFAAFTLVLTAAHHPPMKKVSPQDAVILWTMFRLQEEQPELEDLLNEATDRYGHLEDIPS